VKSRKYKLCSADKPLAIQFDPEKHYGFCKNKGKQQRSRNTIKTVFDAAAHVLIAEGYERSTTNRIAEPAGCSSVTSMTRVGSQQ
jgi:hypothetical protein